MAFQRGPWFHFLEKKSNIFSQILKDENVKPFNVLSVGDNIQDYFASKINSIPFHGIYNKSLIAVANSIPISTSLKGIIISVNGKWFLIII